ncbi:MAG: hypothetical protein M3R51_10270 [Candidatus Eremiobacteraeota bacterium]|nr:hypothetical protein [Candidatus Eremiobacteraeota bacterium]
MLVVSLIFAIMFYFPKPARALVRPAFVPAPAPSQEDLNAAASGTRPWYVRFKGETLVVSQSTPAPVSLPFSPLIDTATMGTYGTQPSETLHVDKSWLTAYYHGEFGGSLWAFNEDGSVGRRLLNTPAYGLTRYGDEVLVETGSSAPFFFKPLRIHRFVSANGRWEEVGHVDFKNDIVDLTLVGRTLYGLAVYDTEPALVAIDFSGNMRALFRLPRDIFVNSIARSPAGDFAIGARGYVIRLHHEVRGYAAAWLAPSDCVRYSPDEPMGVGARCIGIAGVVPYERTLLAPMPNARSSSDGNWLLSPPSTIVHFDGTKWT